MTRRASRTRLLLSATAAATTLAMVTACSPPTPGGTNGPVDNGGPINLTFWTNLTVKAQSDVISSQATRFQASAFFGSNSAI